MDIELQLSSMDPDHLWDRIEVELSVLTILD